MPSINKRSLVIANGWLQAAGIVLIVGFLIMGDPYVLHLYR